MNKVKNRNARSGRKQHQAGEKFKIEPALAGVAGEFYVAAELSRRNCLATLTQRNSKGIDVLASNQKGDKLVSIQVKTNSNYRNNWILNNKAEKFHAPSLFYVFVNLITPSGVPEFHVVPSLIVSEYISTGHKKWLSTTGKKGLSHNDTSMRKFELSSDKYKNNWDILGLS